MSEPDPILGLDLGTSTCLACVVYGGRTVFVRPDLAYSGRDRDQPDYPGEVMPSAFCDRDGVPLVGERALAELSDPAQARNVVREVKRRMHLDGQEPYRLGRRSYSPSEVTAEYVKVLIRAAAVELGLSTAAFKKAVVTVPADFLPTAHAATTRACVLAGLSEDGVQLVDEPVAAAYSLGLHDRPGKQRVLMIDLGGGTFDVALWDVGRGAGPMGFEELGRDGRTMLGGLDWDREIAEWALREARPAFTKDVARRLLKDEQDPGHNNLFRACERAKVVLSTQMKRHGMADPARPIDARRIAGLSVAFRPTADRGEAEAIVEMPGEVFLRRTERLLRDCVDVCHRLFHDVKTIEGRADFGWADLDCVYLAGGGSRLPTVQRRFAECWGRPPVLSENPQHAVVKGAAMLAELWRQGQALPSLIGKTRYKRSIGLLVKPNRPDQPLAFHPIIPRNQELPFRKTRAFPILGDSRLRRLRLQFAEEQFHGDGPAHEKVDELTIDNLPPPPRPGPEEALVTIECGVDGAPAFRLEFRGLVVSKDLKDLPTPGKISPPRNGTAARPAPGADAAASLGAADRLGPAR